MIGERLIALGLAGVVLWLAVDFRRHKRNAMRKSILDRISWDDTAWGDGAETPEARHYERMRARDWQAERQDMGRES